MKQLKHTMLWGSLSLVFGAALWGAVLVAPARAATTVVQDFETAKTSDFSGLKGKGAEGSQLEVGAEQAHGGKQSLRLAYRSTGGWIEFTPVEAPPLNLTGDTLHLALWVKGAGKEDFGDGALRLLDKNNETFQYPIPGLAEAIAGEGWREVRADIDLTKPQAHWGEAAGDQLQRPFAFFGLAATRSAQTPASGTFFIDDMRFSDAPLSETPAVAQNPAPAPPVAAVPAQAAPENAVPTKANASNAVLTIAPFAAPKADVRSPLMKWVFAPGEPALFRANVALREDAQGLFLVWTARDAFDAVLAKGKQAVSGGAGGTVDFRVPNPPRGVLYVTATLCNARQEVLAQAATRAAVFTPRGRPVPLSPFVWGVAAHIGNDNGRDADDEIALMRQIGFGAARWDMTWSAIQPAPNVWNWETTDRIYAAFAREGVASAPILAFSTPWATTGDANSPDWHQWNNTPPRTDAFATFARESVKRYGRQTCAWEVWNEPDIDFWLGTAPQYSALVGATVKAIKEVQPDALVLNGGFSETRRRPDFIPTYLQTVSPHPDIYAIHSHGPLENLLRAEATAHSDLTHAGWTGAKTPPIWMNESGFWVTPSVPESEQAIQLVKKMAYSPAAGFGGYFWYDLRDDGTDANDPEHNFGLVKRDFAPKASLCAANTLLNTLEGHRFLGRLSAGENGYALMYGNTQNTVLAAWRQSSTQGRQVLPLVMRVKTADPASLKMVRRDLFGNDTPIPMKNGLIFLPLGNVPQYVVASGRNVRFEPAQAKEPLLQFAPSVVSMPNEKLPFQVKVSNPFSATLHATLQVEGAPPISVEVAPLATRSYSAVVRGQGQPGSRDTVKIALQSSQFPALLEGVAQIQTAYVVPSIATSLDVTLPQSGVVSLFEATPMKELHFDGPTDLSAQVRFQKTAQGIRVRVTANDQTHFPVAEAGHWWQGDSLQWAIGSPDGRMWEWTAALLPTGPQMITSLSPDGKTGVPAPITIRREGTRTIYEWTLPPTLPGDVPLPERFNFDFLVNDNDGAGRKGWIEWAPGIGMEKNPIAFVPLVIEK